MRTSIADRPRTAYYRFHMQPHDIDTAVPDIAVVGGGLAGGLIALALAKLRPELSLRVFEAGPRAGGNHVWSCFDSDVAPADRWLVDTFTVARWPGYDVRFPTHARTLASPYRSLTGEALDTALRAALPPGALCCGVDVAGINPAQVTLADGTIVRAGGVIDARGNPGLPAMAGGWQKFAGRMLRTAAPHGLDRPIVMDASVDQHDGYRFVYCLPFDDARVFVEDTYYADTPTLDLPLLHARIDAYAAQAGWQVAEVLGEEAGVLPVIARGDFDAFWPADDPVARAGAHAALVHPLTSYSLPDAVRLARHVASLPDLSGPDASYTLARATRSYAAQAWRTRGFYRMLSRMLFGAAAPDERRRVLERFYTLPQPLIERFYAARSTRADQLRVLSGRPPVPLGAALKSLTGGGRPLADLAPSFNGLAAAHLEQAA